MVSVIIPTHNSKRFITDAVNSVLAQSYKDFEVIVVDDGSTDNTKEVLMKYGDKIKYFYQENSGVSLARNRGIKLAKAEYIAFLDADDIWLPEKLEKQIKVFLENSNVSLVCSSCIEFGKNESAQQIIRPRNYKGSAFKDLFFENFIQTSTVLVKRDCLARAGLFDKDLGYSKVEDYDLWLRIAKFFNIYFINEPLVKYRIRKVDNIERNRERIGRIYGRVKIFEKCLLDFEIDISPLLKKRALAKEYYNLAKTYYLESKMKLAQDNMRQALSISRSVGLIFKTTKNPFVKLIALAKPYFILIGLFLLSFTKKSKNRKYSIIKSILYIEGGSGFGGSSNSLLRLLHHLDRKRFKPIVVSFGKGPNTEAIRGLGIEVIESKPKDISKIKLFSKIPYFGLFFSTLPYTFYIFKIMKERDIDLVHLNTNFASGIPGLLAAKILKVPCICHMRGYGRYSKFELMLSHSVDRFLCVSNFLRELLINRQNITPKKIKVIYNGLDLDTFNPRKGKLDLKKELGLENGEQLVGIVARLVKGKGQDDFIKASRIVLNKYPKVKFLIVGDSPKNDGSVRVYLESLSKDLGVSENILFLGWRKDIFNILSALDISIQASRMREGFGNAIMESMAVGTPVIATKVGGCPELIEDGKSGLLVEPSSVQEMAGAIMRLLETPAFASYLGNNGKIRANNMFDIKRVVNLIEATYEEVLQTQ